QQILTFRLLVLSPGEDTEHPGHDEDYGKENGGDLLATRLVPLANIRDQSDYVILFQLATVLCLHTELSSLRSSVFSLRSPVVGRRPAVCWVDRFCPTNDP